MSKIVRLLFALLLAAPPVHAGSHDTCTCQLPAVFDAPDDLRRQLQVMLQQSATFRQQCQLLNVPGLHVQIRTDALLNDQRYRARSIIQRSESGRLTAWVAITPFGNPTEWLAHELEHIIEQIHGVRVQQLARHSPRDAWRTGDNMFETWRAVRVGRLVWHEVHNANRALAVRGVETGGRGD